MKLPKHFLLWKGGDTVDKETNGKGPLWMLISSMLIFGTIGIFRRWIPLPSALLACFRGAVGTLFLVVFLKCRKRRILHGIGKKRTLLLMLTGAAMGFHWILLFEAYNYTTVATVTLCYYMQPTIVILLSPLCFGERLTARKGLCAFIALLGMVLVSGVLTGEMGQGNHALGIVYGLGAAALYAAVVILNKKLPGIDAYEKTVIQLSSSAAVLLPYLLLTTDFSSLQLDVTACVLLLVVGLVHTGVAYALYFGSMDGLKAQTIAVFSYLDPVSALILSALILHEPLNWTGILGAVLILGAALMGETGLLRGRCPASAPHKEA